MKGQLPIISNTIKAYLNEIAERLWMGHAAVMVGSGFSKNAKTKNKALEKIFPDWNQLGDIFYEKIHGRLPNSNVRYLNVLKLADEIHAAFGRPALDQILRTSIPDEEYEPSSLHSKLLELPWTDIFTTNYDTLLERTCVNIDSRKFDIVVNKEDLVYSESPRIVKLHGSFPSERPFIITEEDYRTYPKDFAPFVNTVQQSLLENTLCLIGFSGDDPNFLQWTGWIRDNLGQDNSPKIFLIGIFDLSDAQKKLLEHRNIILVDLSSCSDVNDSYEKSLCLFFDYLLSKKKDDNKLKWPFRSQFAHPNREEEITSQLQSLIETWKSDRSSYANWAILPEDRRRSLWNYTEAWTDIKSYIDKLEPPYDIQFIYELDWRIEKCLCPIFNNNIVFYELILEKYNPFPDVLTINSASLVKDNHTCRKIDWQEIQRQWLKLHLSMLRFYREEGLHEKWDIIDKQIQLLYSKLSDEIIAHLNYERCLYALFKFKIPEVREHLKKWPVNSSLPLWEAKRAGLIAELGNIVEAEIILEKSLSFIRKQLNLRPISNDYSWVSKESLVMQLLQYIKNAVLCSRNQFNKLEEVIKKFGSRWDLLKRYGCDPWLELRLFKEYLNRDPIYTPSVTKNYEFDIGHITTTHHFGGLDSETLTAYSFLRYFEECGMPFSISNIEIGTQMAEGAAKRICRYSPYWALVSCLRTGDARAADILFDRKSISNISSKQIDRFVEEYLLILQESKTEIENGDSIQKNCLGTALASIIPEILSRLCVKCSSAKKHKLLTFLKEIYLSDKKNRYKGIKSLTKRLFASYSEKEQYALLPILLEFPVLEGNSLIFTMDYPDPFYFLNLDKEKCGMYVKVHIENAIVTQLLETAKSKDSEQRKRAIYRLKTLYNLGLLKEEKVKEFGQVVWSNTDPKTCFPQNTSFYKFAFLNTLPHPTNISPVSLFKDYISKEKFPIQGSKQEISITNGDIPFCHELLGATKGPFQDGIDWSEKEAEEIFYRLLKWWDTDKQQLIQKSENSISFNDISYEFKKRFSNLTNILNHVVISRLQSETQIKKDLIRLLNELDDYSVPCIATRAISLCLFPEKKQSIIDDIDKAVLSKNKEEVEEGYEAIWQLLILYKANKITIKLEDLFCHIVLPIKWRCPDNLDSAMIISIRILSNFSDLITEVQLGSLLIGLKYLIKETSLSNHLSSIDEKDRLVIRSLSAKLAYKLYEFYQQKKKLKLPEILNSWKTVCCDPEEFSDIRNKWLLEGFH